MTANESEYISSTHPPVQLQSNVPKPWALDMYSTVTEHQSSCIETILAKHCEIIDSCIQTVQNTLHVPVV